MRPMLGNGELGIKMLHSEAGIPIPPRLASFVRSIVPDRQPYGFAAGLGDSFVKFARLFAASLTWA